MGVGGTYSTAAYEPCVSNTVHRHGCGLFLGLFLDSFLGGQLHIAVYSMVMLSKLTQSRGTKHHSEIIQGQNTIEPTTDSHNYDVVRFAVEGSFTGAFT